MSKKNEKPSAGRVALEYIKIIIIVLVVGFVLKEFVFVNARIPSSSMENTIMVGDRVFGNRLAYKVGDPKRYDIAIFKYPDNEDELFIKRIIGMPGETIIISNGEVYAVDAGTNTGDIPDDQLIADPMMLPFTTHLEDNFIKEDMYIGSQYDFVFRVPEDHYFMLGDNRNCSKDSRYWNNHFVERDKLLGKAGLRYWPINRIGIVGNEVAE